MDATIAGLIIVGLTALLLWGFHLGYQYGRTVERTHAARDRADSAAIDAALAKTRRVRADEALKLAEMRGVAARLHDHGEWIAVHLANRPDTTTHEGA